MCTAVRFKNFLQLRPLTLDRRRARKPWAFLFPNPPPGHVAYSADRDALNQWIASSSPGSPTAQSSETHTSKLASRKAVFAVPFLTRRGLQSPVSAWRHRLQRLFARLSRTPKNPVPNSTWRESAGGVGTCPAPEGKRQTPRGKRCSDRKNPSQGGIGWSGLGAVSQNPLSRVRSEKNFRRSNSFLVPAKPSLQSRLRPAGSSLSAIDLSLLHHATEEPGACARHGCARSPGPTNRSHSLLLQT